MSGSIRILFTCWIYTFSLCQKKTMTMSHKWPNFYKSNFRNYIFAIVTWEGGRENVLTERKIIKEWTFKSFFKFSNLFFFIFSIPWAFISTPPKDKKATSKHESFQLRYVCHFNAVFWGNTENFILQKWWKAATGNRRKKLNA